jgi:hypothetical protein
MAANKHVKSNKAYTQSGGYAEQCLSAVKIVMAFGMEKIEIQNYTNYLEISRKIGRQQVVMLAIGTGTFIGSIYLCYTYAFFMGSVWIQYKLPN